MKKTITALSLLSGLVAVLSVILNIQVLFNGNRTPKRSHSNAVSEIFVVYLLSDFTEGLSVPLGICVFGSNIFSLNSFANSSIADGNVC